ncbi:MAG: hypothetical protein FJ125_13810, partial [Deltaproteobacteria bacterium]|nr:hypothetical protein [Deltaproteobacteria bacterium]
MSQKAEEIVQDVKAGTERIRVVKDLIRTLTKSAKAFKLYNEKHHLVTKFLEEMEQSIENSLKVCGIVILEVTDTSLLLGDDPVYEQKSQEGNYAFRLYKDGIRRLIFRKKPHQKELRSFLDILGRTPMMLAQSQDDMVTLLWKADLESIGYKAIDGFAEMMMGDEEFKDDYRGTLCEILPGFADMLSEQEEGWGTEMRRSEAPQEKLDVGHPEAIYAKSLELLRTSPDHKSQQRLHERMSEEGAEDLLFRHMATVLLRC